MACEGRIINFLDLFSIFTSHNFSPNKAKPKTSWAESDFGIRLFLFSVPSHCKITGTIIRWMKIMSCLRVIYFYWNHGFFWNYLQILFRKINTQSDEVALCLRENWLLYLLTTKGIVTNSYSYMDLVLVKERCLSQLGVKVNLSPLQTRLWIPRIWI